MFRQRLVRSRSRSEKEAVVFFFGDASGGRRVYLAHINDICKGAKHPTTSLRQ